MVLSADKQYLVESRLLPVARKAGLGSLGELVAALKRGNAEALTDRSRRSHDDQRIILLSRQDAIRAISAPPLCRRYLRRGGIHAAFGFGVRPRPTGQEPYSLAMALKEMERQLAGWRIDLIATDLSNEVLEKARQGTLQPV